jgi:hypothetical protein
MIELNTLNHIPYTSNIAGKTYYMFHVRSNEECKIRNAEFKMKNKLTWHPFRVLIIF